jgi:hypothetical protein
MHQPTPAIFQLYRQNFSLLPFLLLIVLFFGQFLLLTGLAYVLFHRVEIAVFVLIFSIPASLYWLESKYTAHIQVTADDRQITLMVTKPCPKIPEGETTYTWTDLQQYRFNGGRDPRLVLQWQGQPREYYYGKDMRALYQYLVTHFPDREWRFLGVPQTLG